MTETQPPQVEPAGAATASPWALGDYHAFAKELVWPLGQVLSDACRIAPGQRVLDVAAGTGNTAIRAAEAGAAVTASDITVENFEAGRREAEARGVALEWIEADAQALPFADGAFDVVTSSLGAIFAPDQRAVADGMLRVCAPGGVVGMVNFRAERTSRAFFELLGGYGPPPPPGARSPLAWGEEQYVRELFGDRVESLQATPGEYVERAASPGAYVAFFLRTFGPLVAIQAGLEREPERAAALGRELLEFAERWNRSQDPDRAEYVYDYLLVIARKRR